MNNKSNNEKLNVEEFKKKYPEYFKRDAVAQEAVEDIADWATLYKDPKEDAVDKAWKIQEALNYYPEGRIKSILEDYYLGMKLDDLCDKYDIKNTKNASVLIYKAKKRVVKHYIKMKKTPIDAVSHVVIKLKVIKLGTKVSYCLKVGKADLSVEPFWVGPTLIRLDDDVQDLLEYNEKYVNDYLEISED